MIANKSTKYYIHQRFVVNVRVLLDEIYHEIRPILLQGSTKQYNGFGVCEVEFIVHEFEP